MKTKKGQKAQNQGQENSNPNPPASTCWREPPRRHVLDAIKDALDEEHLEVVKQLAQREKKLQYAVVREAVAEGIALAKARLDQLIKAEEAAYNAERAGYELSQDLEQER